jgi:triphosphatase
VKVRDEVRQLLCGELWSKFQLYVALCSRTFAENSSLNTPVRDFAPLALSKGWKKLARLGAAAARPSVDQRRAMRRALETFRHTVEFFASLHAESEVARFIKEPKTLQDVLRHINEAATAKQPTSIAHETCPASQDAQRAAGYVLGRHDAQATRCASTLSKAWRRLEKRARF